MSVIFLLPFAAAIVATIVGMVWYGPLFGKFYMQVMGVSPELAEINKQNNKKDMMKRVGIDFVMSFILFLGFLTLMSYFVGTALVAVKFAVVFWLFIIMPNKATSAIWSNKSNKDSWMLFGLTAGYSLVIFLIVAPMFVGLMNLLS